MTIQNYFPLISPKSTFDAVVLCSGDYPSKGSIAAHVLSKCSYVCCCDSAAESFIEREERVPNVIVGDGDSLSLKFQKQYAHIFFKVTEQDDNDQTKATRYCIDKGFHRIAYVGSTGCREDHTLGNISLLMRYAMTFDVEATMITDYGFFTPAKGNATFESFKGQQVSIFNFGCRALRSEGLKWDIYPFDQLWQGTLNEALGNEVRIEADGVYLVYRTFDAKA